MDSRSKWFKCERKIRYRKYKSAMNAIKAMKKKGVVFSTQPVIYKCELCGGYHIGHKKGSNK